jgi:transcriptional regulator with XRE-family HTH domain
MTIGQRLRTARLRRGFSLREFGRELGVTGSAVAQWESSEQPQMRLAHRVRAADVLGIPVIELLPSGANKEVSIKDPEEIFLIERYRSLPARLREAWLRFLVIQAEELELEPPTQPE